MAIWYSIEDTHEFKYSQLPLCLEGIKKIYRCSDEQAHELSIYMDEFKKDCDEEYRQYSMKKELAQ